MLKKLICLLLGLSEAHYKTRDLETLATVCSFTAGKESKERIGYISVILGEYDAWPCENRQATNYGTVDLDALSAVINKITCDINVSFHVCTDQTYSLNLILKIFKDIHRLLIDPILSLSNRIPGTNELVETYINALKTIRNIPDNLNSNSINHDNAGSGDVTMAGNDDFKSAIDGLSIEARAINAFTNPDLAIGSYGVGGGASSGGSNSSAQYAGGLPTQSTIYEASSSNQPIKDLWEAIKNKGEDMCRIMHETGLGFPPHTNKKKKRIFYFLDRNLMYMAYTIAFFIKQDHPGRASIENIMPLVIFSLKENKLLNHERGIDLIPENIRDRTYAEARSCFFTTIINQLKQNHKNVGESRPQSDIIRITAKNVKIPDVNNVKPLNELLISLSIPGVTPPSLPDFIRKLKDSIGEMAHEIYGSHIPNLLVRNHRPNSGSSSVTTPLCTKYERNLLMGFYAESASVSASAPGSASGSAPGSAPGSASGPESAPGSASGSASAPGSGTTSKLAHESFPRPGIGGVNNYRSAAYEKLASLIASSKALKKIKNKHGSQQLDELTACRIKLQGEICNLFNDYSNIQDRRKNKDRISTIINSFFNCTCDFLEQLFNTSIALVNVKTNIEKETIQLLFLLNQVRVFEAWIKDKESMFTHALKSSKTSFTTIFALKAIFALGAERYGKDEAIRGIINKLTAHCRQQTPTQNIEFHNSEITDYQVFHNSSFATFLDFFTDDSKPASLHEYDSLLRTLYPKYPVSVLVSIIREYESILHRHHFHVPASGSGAASGYGYGSTFGYGSGSASASGSGSASASGYNGQAEGGIFRERNLKRRQKDKESSDQQKKIRLNLS